MGNRNTKTVMNIEDTKKYVILMVDSNSRQNNFHIDLSTDGDGFFYINTNANTHPKLNKEK